MCNAVFNSNARSVKVNQQIMGTIKTAEEGLIPDSDSAPVQGEPALERRWMTIEQIAARYQLSTRTIANMMADGRLPYYKVGRAIRFDPEECDCAMRVFRRSSKFDTFIEGETALATHAAGAETSDTSSSEPGRKPRKPLKLQNLVRNKSGDSGQDHLNKKPPKANKTGNSGGNSHHSGTRDNLFLKWRRIPNKMRSNSKMMKSKKTPKTIKTNAFLVTPWIRHVWN